MNFELDGACYWCSVNLFKSTYNFSEVFLIDNTWLIAVFHRCCSQRGVVSFLFPFCFLVASVCFFFDPFLFPGGVCVFPFCFLIVPAALGWYISVVRGVSRRRLEAKEGGSGT